MRRILVDMCPSDPPSEPLVRPADASEAADVAAMHAATRVAWDEAAEHYERLLPGTIELIRAGGRSLYPVEEDLLGDLSGWCRRAVHLQCAGGSDTLSLWNLGADAVVGVDYSARLLDLARRLTEATGAPATWVEADVLAVPHGLDGTADLVYTGRGSLAWVQDIEAWADVVARLVRPGGRFVLFEGHPIEWLFDVDEDGLWVVTDYDYFGGPEASRGWAPEYIPSLSLPDERQALKFARPWQLGQVITALLATDLRLERVTEHPVDWSWSHLDARPEERGRIPLSYSIQARKPG